MDGTGVIIVIIIVFVIAYVLVWVSALGAVRRLLSLTPDGTAFTGGRWQVQTFTGRVASLNTYTTVSDTTEHVRSTGHQALLLVNGAGEQDTATLSGMNAGIFTGQVVTHCWAASGRKRLTFAVLNHSTRQQYISRQVLASVARDGNVLLWVWAAASVVLMIGPQIVIGILQLVVFGINYSRAIDAFERSGLDALWAATAPIAAAIPQP